MRERFSDRGAENARSVLALWRVSFWTYGFMATCLTFALGGGVAIAQDPLGEPAEASSMSPDELTVGSQSMDSRTVSSQNPNDLVVGSHALPSPVEAQKPTVLDGMGTSPDAQPGRAYNVSNLPDADTVRQEVHQQTWDSVDASQPSEAAPRDLAEARRQLSNARARLAGINASVGKMIRRNYPTGEPRLRLYDEQKQAQAQVSQAEHWVENYGGSPSEDDTP